MFGCLKRLKHVNVFITLWYLACFPVAWRPSQISWWRHQMETFSALLVLCARNSPVTGEFPPQRPVTRSFDVFFICAWINGWVNNREAGDLRRHRAHYDVNVMSQWWKATDIHVRSRGFHIAWDLTWNSYAFLARCLWSYSTHVANTRNAARSHDVPSAISYDVICFNKVTSNGSWCMGIKGEMSGTVCVTFTWYMYIYELFVAFVCFVVCSLL